MTSKQRAYLKSLAMKMDPVLQLGKGSVTPENTASVDEALAARELIKISVLQNCLDDPRQMARLMRKFMDKTGLSLGGQMEEAIARMESGDDPEQIEQDMGELMDGDEPFSLETMKKKAQAASRKAVG